VHIHDEAVGEEGIRMDRGTPAEGEGVDSTFGAPPSTDDELCGCDGTRVGLIWKSQLASENTHG